MGVVRIYSKLRTQGRISVPRAPGAGWQRMSRDLSQQALRSQVRSCSARASRAAKTMCHKRGGSNQQTLVPHRSGGQRSEIKVPQGPAPSEASGRGSFWSLPTSGGLGPSLPVTAWRQSLPVSTACLHTTFPSSYKDASQTVLGSPLLQYDLILTNCTCDGLTSK